MGCPSARADDLIWSHTRLFRLLFHVADFLRVGSLPRIDKGVLPHSLHAAADSKSKRGGAAAELKDMLAAAICPREAAIIQCVMLVCCNLNQAAISQCIMLLCNHCPHSFFADHQQRVLHHHRAWRRKARRESSQTIRVMCLPSTGTK